LLFKEVKVRDGRELYKFAFTEIAPEKNSIMNKFTSFRNSFKKMLLIETLLQLKMKYYNQSLCLQCSIGMDEAAL
jgi:hypothetical protein